MNKIKVNGYLDMTDSGWYAHPSDTWCGFVPFESVKAFRIKYDDYEYYVAIYYDDDSYIRCSPNCGDAKDAKKHLEKIIEVNESRLKTDEI